MLNKLKSIAQNNETCYYKSRYKQADNAAGLLMYFR